MRAIAVQLWESSVVCIALGLDCMVGRDREDGRSHDMQHGLCFHRPRCTAVACEQPPINRLELTQLR